MNEQRGIMFVLSGPAGSGKSTVREKLMSRGLNFHYSVSSTTRAPRGTERAGIDYNYISKEEFEKGIADGAFYEYTNYTGDYYGTPKAELIPYIEKGVNVILEIEVDGALQVKKNNPDAVLVMLLAPSYSVLERRLRGRNTENEERIRRRLDKARVEMTHFSEYDYYIINNDNGIDECVGKLETIAAAEALKTRNTPEFPEKFFNN